jgi:CheY-like chemotaxis protein
MRRALVVEDDADLLELYALCLRIGGWTVVTADSVELAMRRVEERPPDIVVTDFAMPRGDGLQLAARVRELLPDRRLPVVVVTANPDWIRTRVAAGDRLMACRLLAKPTVPDQLAEVAAETLDACGKTCTGPRSPWFDPDLCGCGRR